MHTVTTTNTNCNQPIGVFDSGVGGLTVLRELLRLLPEEDYIYLGDTARLPYGAKSPETVIRYALQSSRHLIDRGVKMLVIACNTATSAALPALEAAYPNIPVVGVVRPGARAACAVNANGRMAVIATEATVRGAAYQKAILELCPDMHVESLACPLFVALAEEGWTEGDVVNAIIAKQLEPLLSRFGDQPPDSLVLGCTHFPVLAKSIIQVVGPNVAVIDSAATTAQEVKHLLHTRALYANRTSCGHIGFLATDGPERFARVGSIFLGRTLTPHDVSLVDL
ncbi:glutamate racemase [Desulfovibrio inopinatus]|uniref:glutamate racemase n=1 Tax=Desulfovibrio inopinatus TaxID=102109 RepID=UPI0004104C9C|nr:glutamate racemase [Desulfovibrio inopinatus]